MAPPMKRVVFGEYSTVLPTVPAGETHALQCDSNAVLLVKLAAGGASTTVRVATPSAYATSALAKEEAIYGSGGGKLAAVYAINNSGALKYLQLFDATSTPGAVVRAPGIDSRASRRQWLGLVGGRPGSVRGRYLVVMQHHCCGAHPKRH